MQVQLIAPSWKFCLFIYAKFWHTEASDRKIGHFFTYFPSLRLGRVAEWPNASVSKTDLPAMATGVRIPPLPTPGMI